MIFFYDVTPIGHYPPPKSPGGSPITGTIFFHVPRPGCLGYYFQHFQDFLQKKECQVAGTIFFGLAPRAHFFGHFQRQGPCQTIWGGALAGTPTQKAALWAPHPLQPFVKSETPPPLSSCCPRRASPTRAGCRRFPAPTPTPTPPDLTAPAPRSPGHLSLPLTATPDCYPPPLSLTTSTAALQPSDWAVAGKVICRGCVVRSRPF